MASQSGISSGSTPLSSRKSRRHRKPTKYTLDVLDPLRGVFSDEESDTPKRKRQADLDDEFDDGGTPMEEDAFEESEIGDFGDRSPSEQSDNAEEDDAMSIAEDGDGHTSTSLWDYARKMASLRNNDGEDHRTVTPYTGRLEGRMGIPYHELRSGAREDFIKAMYGPLEADIEKVFGVQIRWQSDPVLPQRFVDSEGALGVAHTPWYSDEQRSADAERAWAWYEDKEYPRKLQRFTTVDRQQAEIYFPRADEDLAFLLGPHTGQTLYTLGLKQYMNFAQAWEHENGEDGSPRGTREGWMLNVGGRIQTMDWAPNRLGKSQILALSVGTEDLTKLRERSVYLPNPGPSSIQLWEISSKQEPGPIGRLDMETEPRLLKVICVDWGELKQLKWCPVTRSLPNHIFGLIATVWGDGRVRIFECGIVDETLPDTEYVKFEQPLFTGELANTMCTCVDWISSTTVAVGHSNGMVAVWDISAGRLLVAHAVQRTFITAISVAYPSRPHIVASTSIEGCVHLTSLPTLDTTMSQRLAYGNNVLSWNDHLQLFLTYDNLYNIRMHPLRRFSNTSTIIQTRSTILHVACSPCHPFILACGTGGEVEATNLIRRFFDQHHRRLPAFQQTWFIHEWRPISTQAEADVPELSTPTVYKSLSRIQEGFSINITHDTRHKPLGSTNPHMKMKYRGKAKRTASSKVKEGRNRNIYGIIPQTIHELQTAVTTVAWNPNLECGGWAAAGLGNGLLRIEDLCL